MKAPLISLCVIALFSATAFAVKSNTFHYSPLVDSCEGVICTSEQYCDTENIPRPVCKRKLNLNDACTKAGEGQCMPSNSECLGDPLQCRCNSAFVEFQDACIPSCEAKECQANFFCHEGLTGCLPKVNLNSDCDENGGAQQCKTENAECLKQGDTPKCTCSAEFVEKNGMCIPKCTQDSDSSCTPIEFCEAASGLCKPKKPLGQSCTDNKECLTLNSACEGSTCQCESDAFVELYGACFPDCVKNTTACDTATQYCSSTDKICNRKANLHERCSDEPGSCLTENAVCTSGTNTCECSTGFIDVGSTCMAVCTDDTSCTSEQFCNLDNGQCETKRQLGQQCSATVKCSTDLRCLNEVCACQDDSVETVVNGTRGCIKKCEDNASCDIEKELYCSTTLGLCTPQLGLNGVCNLDDVNEEKEINPCKTPSASCRLPSDTETVPLCLCNADFVQDGVSCIAKCANNADCNSTQKFCHIPTGVCEQKVPTLDGECLPSSEGTEQCLIANSDCMDPGATGNYKCTCTSGHKERNGACDLICTDSTDCLATEYCDSASSKFCMNKVGLNQPCSYEDQCSNANAKCSGEEGNKECKCETNYIEVSGYCKPDCTALQHCNATTQFCNAQDGQCRNKAGLNLRCNSDSECLNEESTFCSSVSKTCKCKTEEYYEDSNTCLRKCTKTTVCDFTEQYCNELTSKCDRKVDLNGMCTVEGEEQCTALSTCESDSETANKRCRCLPVAIPSQNEKKCLKLASGIGDVCEEPQQCQVIIGNPGGITNTTECATNKCDCTTTAIRSGGKCYLDKSLGNSCVEDDECSIPIVDGTCNKVTQECGCKTDSIGSSTGKKCLKFATAIGDACEEPQQCSVSALIGNNGVTNTTQCTSNNKCDCASSTVSQGGKCYLIKSLGDVCTQDVECSVSISGGKCDTASNKCICSEGTEGSVGGKQCSKPSSGTVGPVNAKFYPVWAILALITSFCFLP